MSQAYSVETSGAPDDFKAEDYFVLFKVNSQTKFEKSVAEGINKLRNKGFITATLDSTYTRNDTIVAACFVGLPYQFAEIEIDSADQVIAEAAGLKNTKWKEKVFSSSMIAKYSSNVGDYLSNNGYPFAKVGLKETYFDREFLHGKMSIAPGPKILYDSLKVTGSLVIEKSFLRRHLNIAPGKAFRRDDVFSIDQRLQNLPYIEIAEPTAITFVNNEAAILLNLDQKNSSRFDFIIGVLPSTDALGERRFTITGDFTAELYNRFGQGEYFFAKFQRLKPETQELELRFSYPYIANYPLGFDGNFSLYRNTTDFLELKANAGMIYQLNRGLNLKASWNTKSSRLIEVDTATILTRQQLPSNLDIVYNGGGLELRGQDLDYNFNPSKGWEFSVNGIFGIKNIIENNQILALTSPDETVDFSTSYDSLKLSTFQVEFGATAAYYQPLWRSGTLKFSVNSGIQYNEEKVFDNEFYRIGGNRLLRGFDEQSVLTDMYLVSTLEMRFLLDQNSYLSFPFVDYGYTRLANGNDRFWDQAIAFGVGINFSTAAGIFNVSFASGSRLNTGFDLENTKIHFGYVSLF